jgi:hypothetical protein
MDEKFLGLLGEKAWCQNSFIVLSYNHSQKNLLGKSFDVDGKSIFKNV